MKKKVDSEIDGQFGDSPKHIDNSSLKLKQTVLLLQLIQHQINTTTEIDTHTWGGINVFEDTGLTSREGVYVEDDAVTGAATVILAMEAGKKSAFAIHQYLLNTK